MKHTLYLIWLVLGLISCSSLMADDCITFESSVEFTLQFAAKNWDGTLEYSSDGTNWVEWDNSTPATSGEVSANKHQLFLRGSNNTVINSQLIYTPTAKYKQFSCSGNIMTLLDYQHPEDVAMGDYCFYQFFKECSLLQSAPALPAMTLSSYCYAEMFYKCSGIQQAPELPALILASHCYENMFTSCSGLDATPTLPATQLAPACYKQMFYSCYNLVDVCALPATTLADNCYEQMFSRCSKMIQAQSILPAMVLKSSCYDCMFEYCSKLENVPQLPATTLAASCYRAMFGACTALKIAPALPALNLEAHCYDQMFYDCSALIQAPELPATTLAAYCYWRMFYRCTSLTQAPELPATVLVDYCYQYLFYKCPISSISVSFTEWDNYATLYWVTNVASEGEFFAPVELRNERGENRIPQNWKFGAKISDDLAKRQTLLEGQIEIQNQLTSWKADASPMNLCILRTLYCDGDYNTICLPFSLDAEQLASSPLAGYSALRRFVSSTVEGTGADQNLILTIEDVTEIEAGVPYLIAFPEGEDIINPFFEGVTITCDEATTVGDGVVTFNGTLIPTQLPSTDDYLFIGAHNKLYWPKPDDSHMRGFRAYLKVNTSASSPARRGMPASFQMGKGIVTNQIEHQSDVTTLRKLVKEGRVVIVDGAKKYNLQGQSIE